MKRRIHLEWIVNILIIMRNRIYLTSVKRFGLSRWEECIVGLIINVLGLRREEPDPWRDSNPGTQPLLLWGKEDYLYQISVVFQAGCLKYTSFEQTWIPFTRGCVVSSTVESPCWEVVNFAYHLPLETFLPLSLSDTWGDCKGLYLALSAATAAVE